VKRHRGEDAVAKGSVVDAYDDAPDIAD